MTISEAFELYRLECIAFRGQSPKTEENHQVCQKSLVVFFGDIGIEDLTFDLVRRWKAELDKHRKPATVRNYIIKLRVVLTYLKKRGYGVLDPDLIPVPKKVDTVPEFLTKEQVAHLIASTGRLKNKAIISLLYGSGLRVSELCGLNKGQIRDGRFTVVGKGGKARLCFIDQRSQTLLDLYLETRTDNNPALFLTDSGLRITPGVIQDTFRSVRKTSGIEVHPHTLRHSFATDLMNNGMHIYPLSRLMGHSSIQTTSIYLHTTDPKLQEEYEQHHRI